MRRPARYGFIRDRAETRAAIQARGELVFNHVQAVADWHSADDESGMDMHGVGKDLRLPKGADSLGDAAIRTLIRGAHAWFWQFGRDCWTSLQLPERSGTTVQIHCRIDTTEYFLSC